MSSRWLPKSEDAEELAELVERGSFGAVESDHVAIVLWVLSPSAKNGFTDKQRNRMSTANISILLADYQVSLFHVLDTIH